MEKMISTLLKESGIAKSNPGVFVAVVAIAGIAYVAHAFCISNGGANPEANRDSLINIAKEETEID